MRLEINGWSSKTTFSATHLIAGHSKCGRLHGHDYAINAVIEGDIGSDGVVMDFISVKEFLREVASELDHKVLVPGKDPSLVLKGESLRYSTGGKSYEFPRSDCVLLDVAVTSAEEIAEWVIRRLLEKVRFPKNVRRVEIGVDEGRGQGVWTSRDV
ncbi:MAG: 6-pyruvoyltetrahydropterin/6-carboxytetrahydropterin synthase [Candidatus Thermoplasmatota archaeon]|nr:6-pyruvoyltetrahydropterin/6-carboxytetrahydropterin synthase [Candidatus Thermoplasmatota archaeon]